MTDLTPFFAGILEALGRPVAKAQIHAPKGARNAEGDLIGGRFMGKNGLWEHDPGRDVRVVKLEGAPMVGSEQTKEHAKTWALAHITGTFENEATGWKVDVAGRGVKEALAHLDWGSPAALQTLAAVPDLIRVAVPVQTEPNKSPKHQPDIRQVHTLIAPILVEEEIRRARMTIRETNMGRNTTATALNVWT